MLESIIFQGVSLEELIELFASAKSKEDPFYELGRNVEFLKFKLVHELKVDSKSLTKLSLRELVSFTRETMWESRLEETRVWLEKYRVHNSVEELKNLTRLSLNGNTISNVGSKNLTCFVRNHDKISDVSPLKELKNLTELDLRGNKISDVSPLKELKKLTYLDVSYNKISDVGPLKELKNLTILQLGENKISDVSPLKELVNLTRLYLYGNNIKHKKVLGKLRNIAKF
jgi:Leucine-rich repeat (LRR) protein